MTPLYWFLAIAGIIFFFLWYNDKNNHLHKKAIGALLISAGIILIVPPYPSILDIPLFLWFLHYKGVSSLQGLISSGYYIQFVLLSIILGIILIYFGMRISHKNFSSIRRKIGI